MIRNGWMIWIGVTGIFCTLWTSGRKNMDSRPKCKLKCYIFCAAHQLWAATEQQVTNSAHGKFPWKRSLCLWAVLCFWFSTPVPSAGPSTTTGCTTRLRFSSSWVFSSPALSVYLLCESSDGGKWLRTVIETVPFVHKKDSMCHVLCFWLVFGCICI